MIWKKCKTSNYNVFAEIAKPLLLKYLDEVHLNIDEEKYLDIFKKWNLKSNATETGPTVFKSMVG